MSAKAQQHSGTKDPGHPTTGPGRIADPRTILLGLLAASVLALASWYFEAATPFEAILLGLFLGILEALIVVRVAISDTQTELKREFSESCTIVRQDLAQFGAVNSALIDLELHRSRSSLPNGLNRNLIETFHDNLSLWQKRVCRPDAAMSDQRDLWLAVLALYLREESRDLKAKKLATNIEIYVAFLMNSMKYHVDKYGNDAVVRILTSILPHQWWDWGSRRAKKAPGTSIKDLEFQQEVIDDYRERIADYILQMKRKSVAPDFRRYIIVCGSGSSWEPRDELMAERHRERRAEYVKRLHFEPNQARYYVDSGMIPPSYRDILFFGRKCGRDVEWRWGIESNMDPGFTVMFTRFYDTDDLAIPAFVPEKNVDLPRFLAAVEKDSHPLLETARNTGLETSSGRPSE